MQHLKLHRLKGHADFLQVSDGMVNTGAMRPLARLGYMQYGVITPDTTLVINRPELDEDGEVKDEQAAQWDGAYR